MIIVDRIFPLERKDQDHEHRKKPGFMNSWTHLPENRIEAANRYLECLVTDECDLEDHEDLAVIEQRRDEPKVSLEEFERELKAGGLL